MFGVVQEEKEEPKVRRTSHFHFSRLPFRFQKILPWLGSVSYTHLTLPTT